MNNLIIKDQIAMFKKGYPTVSDKYNVSGAVLAGTRPAKFGELVKFSSTKNYFEAIDPSTGVTAVTDIGGFVLATNVKLAEDFPGTNVQVNPGEAFNLLVNGFMAIELDAGATEAQVLANSKVYVILATGKLTTSDKANSGTIVELPGVVFTGMVENHGTTASPKLMAEIYVK